MLHGRVRPIVRQALDHGVPGTAVRAIDVRVKIPRVRRIEHLRETVVTYRKIGRNAYRRMSRGLALADREFLETALLSGSDLHRSDLCGRWRLTLKITKKRFECRLRALQMNVHAVRLVQHPARKCIRASQTKHKRAKADPLHHPAHSHAARDRHRET